MPISRGFFRQLQKIFAYILAYGGKTENSGNRTAGWAD